MVYFHLIFSTMTTLRYITAGESHGKALTGILEGIPWAFTFIRGYRQGPTKKAGRLRPRREDEDRVRPCRNYLRRRWGKTIGSPVTLLIENRDFMNWSEGMSSDPAFEGSIPPVTKPRPGHADLTGAMESDYRDVRNILERSSARETAMRVALGAIAKKFLSVFISTSAALSYG